MHIASSRKAMAPLRSDDLPSIASLVRLGAGKTHLGHVLSRSWAVSRIAHGRRGPYR